MKDWRSAVSGFLTRNRKTDLTEGPFLRKIIAFAIPVMLTSLFQLLFNAADLVVVGQSCGPECVGAVGATTSLIHLLVNTFIGLSIGAGVVIAQRLGSGDAHGVHRAVHTAIPIALVSGAILTGVGVFFTETFLTWMGTPEELLPLAALYLRIYFAGIIPILLYNFGAAILRAAGDTQTPLFILIAAGILNIGMNLLFVLVFGMTVDGVALATVLSQLFSAAMVMLVLCRRNDACRLNWKKLCFDGSALKKILRIGVPSGLQSSLFHISNVIIQSSINTFGSDTVQGNSAAASAASLINVTMVCFYHAAMNIIGQNCGAKKYDNIKKITWLSLACAVTAGLIFGVSLYVFARPVLSVYLNADATEAAFQAGTTRFLWMCVPYFLHGSTETMTGCLRGLGYSLQPMLITVFGSCGVRLFFALVLFRFEAFHSLPALLVSYPISWFLTFSIEFVCFWILLKRAKERDELPA